MPSRTRVSVKYFRSLGYSREYTKACWETAYNHSATHM